MTKEEIIAAAKTMNIELCEADFAHCRKNWATMISMWLPAAAQLERK